MAQILLGPCAVREVELMRAMTWPASLGPGLACRGRSVAVPAARVMPMLRRMSWLGRLRGGSAGTLEH